MYSAEIEDSIGKGASSSAIRNELIKMADISIDKKVIKDMETSFDKDVESEIQKSVEKDIESQIEKQMEKEAWEALGKQEGVETTGKEADVVGLTAYVPDLKSTGIITKHDVKNKKVNITLDDKKIVTRDIDKIALTQESAEKIGIKPKTETDKIEDKEPKKTEDKIEEYDFTKPADTKQFFLDEVEKAGGN